MADSPVLSQREIDALLSASAEEPSPEGAAAGRPDLQPVRADARRRAIKRYDFRHPDKFSKDQLRTLRAVHETFARLAASMLSNQLRTNVSIKVSAIDQGLYEEYVGRVPLPSFVSTLQMAPLDGVVLLQFGQDVGLTIVDRMLGGTGSLLEYEHETTDIELQLLRGIAAMMADDLGEAWENLAAVQPTVLDLHEDMQQVSLVPPTEVVIMVFLEVAVLNVVAVASLCTPFSALEPVLARLTAQVLSGSNRRRESAEQSRERLQAQLHRTPATMRVELGEAQVPALDVAQLAAGDVIRLNSRVDRPVPVRIGSIRKWLGRPGQVGNRLAVAIDQWAPEEMPPPAEKPGPPETEPIADPNFGAPPALTVDANEEREAHRAA